MCMEAGEACLIYAQEDTLTPAVKRFLKKRIPKSANPLGPVCFHIAVLADAHSSANLNCTISI